MSSSPWEEVLGQGDEDVAAPVEGREALKHAPE
jgi:hypothetical protein